MLYGYDNPKRDNFLRFLYESMEKKSKTLSGVFSTLRDNIALLTRGIGEELVDALDLKGRASQMVEFVSSLREPIVGMVRGIRDFVSEHPRLFSMVGGFLAIAVAIKGVVVVVGLLKMALLALNVNPFVLGLTLAATLLIELIGEGDSFGAKLGSVIDKLNTKWNNFLTNVKLIKDSPLGRAVGWIVDVAGAANDLINPLQVIANIDTAAKKNLAIPEAPSLSLYIIQLQEALKTAEGFKSVMGGLQAGQQDRGAVAVALHGMSPGAKLEDIDALLMQYERGQITIEEFQNSLAKLSAESQAFKETVKIPFMLTDSEKIGNSADQAAASLSDWQLRVMQLRDAYKAGEISQQQYITAMRTQTEAYDKLTGGAAAYIAKLEEENALIGLSAEQRKRHELTKNGASAQQINRISDLQAESKARTAAHTQSQNQNQLDIQAQREILRLRRDVANLPAGQAPELPTGSSLKKQQLPGPEALPNPLQQQLPKPETLPNPLQPPLPPPELQADSKLQDQIALLETEKTIRKEILDSQLKLARSLHGAENVRLAEVFKVDAGKLAEIAELANLDKFDIATQLGLGVKQAEQLLTILNNNKAVAGDKPKATTEPDQSSSAALVGSGEVYSRILAATRQSSDPALKEAKKQTKIAQQVVAGLKTVNTTITDNEGVLIA